MLGLIKKLPQTDADVRLDGKLGERKNVGTVAPFMERGLLIPGKLRAF